MPVMRPRSRLPFLNPFQSIIGTGPGCMLWRMGSVLVMINTEVVISGVHQAWDHAPVTKYNVHPFCPVVWFSVNDKNHFGSELGSVVTWQLDIDFVSQTSLYVFSTSLDKHNMLLLGKCMGFWTCMGYGYGYGFPYPQASKWAKKHLKWLRITSPYVYRRLVLMPRNWRKIQCWRQNQLHFTHSQ